MFQLPKSRSIKTEILFIERCLELLKEGGRLGIVLPEGIFNNPNALYVRKFVEDQAYLKAVISLPQETFLSAKTSVKTSLLFLQKFTQDEKKKWLDLLQRKKNHILIDQQEKREKIKNIIGDRNTNTNKKRELKKRLKELDQQVIEESRKQARVDFDYPIFMCEAEDVGITPTGETGDDVPNDLPEILKAYQKFSKHPEKFIAST